MLIKPNYLGISIKRKDRVVKFVTISDDLAEAQSDLLAERPGQDNYVVHLADDANAIKEKLHAWLASIGFDEEARVHIFSAVVRGLADIVENKKKQLFGEKP